MFFRTLSGVMPWAALYSCWMARRRFVSPVAAFMDSVVWSAYRIALPSTLRAARPIVCISDPEERRKPSLSASRIATRETSGRSRPSRSRLIPTRTSNSPLRRSRRMRTLSRVSMSECR
jgi:hypothetical protein